MSDGLFRKAPPNERPATTPAGDCIPSLLGDKTIELFDLEPGFLAGLLLRPGTSSGEEATVDAGPA